MYCNQHFKSLGGLFLLDTLNPTLGPTTALEREVLLAFRKIRQKNGVCPS